MSKNSSLPSQEQQETSELNGSGGGEREGDKGAKAFCPGWRHQPGQKGGILSRLVAPTGTKGSRSLLSRLETPTGTKDPLFCPGWCLQPGQKPLHGLTSIDILLFVFTAPLSPSLISFFFPRHLLPVNFLPSRSHPSHSLPSMRPSPARAGTGEPPHGRGRGPASHRGGAGCRACRTASCRRCRPAGTARTGAGQQQSSRPAAAALDRPAAVGRQETTRPAAAAAQTGAGWGLPSRHRSAWPSAGVRDSCRRGPARARTATNRGLCC